MFLLKGGLVEFDFLNNNLCISDKLLKYGHHKVTHKTVCENKGAGQLRGNSAADQRLCFRYIDNTIPLFS